jgi:hypothetical protein
MFQVLHAKYFQASNTKYDHTKFLSSNEICGYHGDDTGGDSLLGCDAVTWWIDTKTSKNLSCSEDRGSRFLQNTGTWLPKHMVSNPTELYLRILFCSHVLKYDDKTRQQLMECNPQH